ncbi:hypothetical protein [Spiroplasma cantharicola]|uniref:Uncharacterized protein n=1 Tax=Spiroplasma cantharicola TaxID=362837 RepID=A0A0M3SJC4_9MOLU|nr:hypothetical protein [Spiroplasma cantharicola]ALD66508.1 hypothetical protein SCANT_v1c06020 [Spiroplasma cantharicola]
MKLEKINNFEEPIFENHASEINRIFSSEIFFKINMTNFEFWEEFLKYLFLNLRTKNFEIEKLKIGINLNISDTKNNIKNYLITEYIENERIELAHLNSDETVLTKIFIRTKQKKENYSTSIWYLESQRTIKEINKKEHKKLQSAFNAKVVNKVLLLKDYLLNRVRDIK